MIRKSDPAWPWMVGAFCGAWPLASIVLIIEGTGVESLKLSTARHGALVVSSSSGCPMSAAR